MLYFEFEPEEGDEERDLIAPEEDLPEGGGAQEDDVRRDNAPIGSIGDRHPMAALTNIL